MKGVSQTFILEEFEVLKKTVDGLLFLHIKCQININKKINSIFGVNINIYMIDYIVQ